MPAAPAAPKAGPKPPPTLPPLLTDGPTVAAFGGLQACVKGERGEREGERRGRGFFFPFPAETLTLSLHAPLHTQPGDALVLPHGAVATVLGIRCDGPGGGAPRLWVRGERGAEAPTGLAPGGGGGGEVGGKGDATAAAATATPLGGGYWRLPAAVQVRLEAVRAGEAAAAEKAAAATAAQAAQAAASAGRRRPGAAAAAATRPSNPARRG